MKKGTHKDLIDKGKMIVDGIINRLYRENVNTEPDEASCNIKNQNVSEGELNCLINGIQGYLESSIGKSKFEIADKLRTKSCYDQQSGFCSCSNGTVKSGEKLYRIGISISADGFRGITNGTRNWTVRINAMIDRL